MKKLCTSFFVLLLSFVAAFAQETKTFTLNFDENGAGGEFVASNPTTTYRYKFTSNTEIPITIQDAAGKNNMWFHFGTFHMFCSTWSISVPEGYVLKGYSFDFLGYNGPKDSSTRKQATVTPEGGTSVTSSTWTSQAAQVKVSDLNTAMTKFTVGGEWTNITPTNFQVTVAKVGADVPAETDGRVVVFDNKSSEVPFRIPALAKTRDGKLLAVCDYRYNKSDIGNYGNGTYKIDEVMRVSDDNGCKWGEMRTIAKGDDYASEEWRVAFGDPSIVADRTSDKVLMQCVAGKVGYFASSASHRQESVFFLSEDGGKTWDKGTRMTDKIYGLYENLIPDREQVAGIFLTSGKIMQSRYVKKGDYYRLYIAHPLRTSMTNKYATYVIYSDDFGKTWQVLGGAGVIPSDAADESKVDELPDGTVLLSCRNQGGGRKFNTFTYTNALQAEGHWNDDVMPSNMTGRDVNACNGELLVVPAKRKSDNKEMYLVLQSVPLSANRVNVGFFYKAIESNADFNTQIALGNGWEKGLCVTTEPSCYSTMVLMDNDSIGFMYEENSYNGGYDIVFKSLSLEEITDGKFELMKHVDRGTYLYDALQGKFDNVTEGNAVGNYVSTEGLQEAVEKFNTEKTESAYEALMQVVDNMEKIELVDGKEYLIRSCHDNNRYLVVDPNRSSMATDVESKAQYFTFKKEGDTWTLSTMIDGTKWSMGGDTYTNIRATDDEYGVESFEIGVNANGKSTIKTLRPKMRGYDYLSYYGTLAMDELSSDEAYWNIIPKKVSSGIQKIDVEAEGEDKVYDLQGRLVENPSKGIYIVNGKKVIY